VRPDEIAVILRRRNPWEALDLGHAMLRAWARRVYGAWFATYWPAGIAISLLLWSSPEYVMFVLWWLKPLFDRVLLHVCGRSVLGNDSGVRDVLRELPRLWRAPGVLSALSLRRFSLARSFLLPVWQLEEQRGAAARARFRLLSRRYRGYAVWLTFFCANMSTVLLFAILITGLALAPGDGQNLSPWQWFGGDASSGQYLVRNVAFMLAETVVEPLYVASGLALYLNRRSELEAWDIERGLRRLADRQAAQAAHGVNSANSTASAPSASTRLLSALAFLCFCPLLLPAPAVAEEWQAAPVSSTSPEWPDAEPVADDLGGLAGQAPASHAGPRSAARQAITAVLADPVFGQDKDDWTWRWRRQAEPASDDGYQWLPGIGKAIELLAQALTVIAWILAGLGLAAAIFVLIRYRERQRGATVQARAPFLFGLDLRPESLPTDVAAAARAALAAGNVVEALSLLYRGALLALIEGTQIEFACGDTESDCLRRVAGRLPAAAERCFAALVDAWGLAAYGRLPVPVTTVEQILAAWELHFGTGVARS
jgi:hypothetical protein